MVEQGETWTLSDGNKYTVVSIVKEEDNKKYVYLVNRADVKKFVIAEYTGDELIEIEDPDLMETLIVKFNEDLKESLPKLISENI